MAQTTRARDPARRRARPESARARRNVMRIKHPQRKTAVKLSMARIKQVLAERRQAYRDTE